MKVTQNTTYRMLETNLGRISTRLEELRSQGATGLKLNKPSDDPASIRPVLTTRTQIRTTERYLETMSVSLDKMESTDGHLAHVENILQRVKEIGINAVNGAYSPEDMIVLADEVANLKKELLDSSNGMVDGKFIFAGFQEDTIPFIENDSYVPADYLENDSTTWPVYYQGDAHPTELEITPGELIEVNLTGNELFMGITNADMQAGGPSPPAIYSSASGNTDLFSALTRMEEAIRAGNIGDSAGAGGGIEQNLTVIETAADQNRRLRSQLGNRANRVETAMFHQEDVLIDLEQILSRYQDADAIETFNNIVQQETAFQAALSITAKVSDISILDFL